MILNWEKFNESIKVKSDEYIELLRTDNYLLIIPLTHKAARKYGMGTKWCLTDKNDPSDFDRHNRLGKIAFIVIRNSKIQQEFGTTSWCLYLPNGVNKFRFIAFNDKNYEFKGGYDYLENEFEKLNRESDFWLIISKYIKWVENNNLNESLKSTIPILMSLMLIKPQISKAQVNPIQKEVYLGDLDELKKNLYKLGEVYVDDQINEIISKVNRIIYEDATLSDISNLSSELEEYIGDLENSQFLSDSLFDITEMNIKNLEDHRRNLMKIYKSELAFQKKSSKILMITSIVIVLILIILIRKRKETI